MSMSELAQTGKISRTSLRTRARIVEAVVEMITRHGISGTTIANVAKAAGVSQGVVVFHFKTKEHLLAQTLLALFDEYRQCWQQAAATVEPLERVLGLMAADFDPRICTREKLAVWFAFWGEAAAKPLYNRICTEAEEERAAAMREACLDLARIADIADPLKLAHAIDAHTDGLWLQMHIQGSETSLSDPLGNALGHLRMLVPDMADRF